jgi:hypothetical protein
VVAVSAQTWKSSIGSQEYFLSHIFHFVSGIRPSLPPEQAPKIGKNFVVILLDHILKAHGAYLRHTV